MYNDPNAQPPYGQNPSPYSSSYEQQYAPTEQPPAQYPPTQYGGMPPVQPTMPPVQPAMPQPVYMVQPPPKKSSNKTLWIVLGIVLGVLILGGGGCCTALSLGIIKGSQSVVQTVNAQETADAQTAIADESSPQEQAESYYDAISVQDYETAYGYLAQNMKLSDGTLLTQTLFTQKAEALDSSEGEVSDYTATADPNDSTKVTVQVTRTDDTSGKTDTYAVHLTFVQDNTQEQWDISSFDNI